MDLDRSSGTVHRIDPQDPLLPTIFPFKVTSITFVGEDRLQEWEDAMRDKVGISTVPHEEGGIRPQLWKPGCGTVSGSGDGWDDCDYWGRGC